MSSDPASRGVDRLVEPPWPAVERYDVPDPFLRARAPARSCTDRPLARSSSTAAADLIREGIRTGRLAPGFRLKELEIAAELGLSRTPVREALIALQAEGVLDATPTGGAIVPSWDADAVRKLYRLRAMLEGFATRLAAEHLSTVDIKQLVESCDRLESLSDLDETELVDENARFHGMILRAARDRKLSQVVRSVTELPWDYKRLVWRAGDRRRITTSAHRDIADALSSGKAHRAGRAMEAHILGAGDALVSQMQVLARGRSR